MTPAAEKASPAEGERSARCLRGLVTEADLPQAEQEWPGLRGFLDRIPPAQRPRTFLDLVWRFECWRESIGLTLRLAR
jgi:hypothetical protein